MLMMWGCKLVTSFLLGLAVLLAPAPTPWSASASAQSVSPTVAVRSAEHSGYSRIVFDIRGRYRHQTTIENNRLIMRFDRPVLFNFDRLGRVPLANVGVPVQRVDNGKQIIEFAVPEGATLRQFNSGTSLVIDVLAPGEEARAVAAVTGQPIGGTAPDTATGIAPEPGGNAAASGAEIQPAPGRAANGAASGAQQAIVIPEPDPLATVPDFPGGDGGEGADFTVTYEVIQGLPQLSFDWAYPVAAAAFLRAGYLWVVFDEPARADLSAVTPYLNDRLLSAEQIPNLEATLLRFRIAEAAGLQAMKQGSRWTVSVRNAPMDPNKSIMLARQETNDDGTRIFIPLDRPGSKLRLYDPEVGDEILVVPLIGSGVGIPRSRRFAQFEVLASAQGLVMQSYSDQIVITRFSNGVAIGSVANLALSAPQLSGRIGEVAGNGTVVDARRIIELDKWRLGDLSSFTARKQQLFRALANDERSNINNRRWDLARFYLGHRMASEALAFLNLMIEEDPTLSESPPFLAVRGVSLFRLGRLEGARQDLFESRLDAETDIYLWRAMVAEASGNPQEALQLYERGREILDLYDDLAKADFQLVATRAALDIGRIDFANWELAWLRRQPLTEYQRAEDDYLEGRFLLLMGEIPEAMAYFDGVDERANRRAAALAKFALANSSFERGEISAEDATEEMEQLRYSWRGDLFELTLLETLGNIYLENGEYRHGLETLRDAVTNFPAGERGRAIAGRMSREFRDLFLGADADNLPPISALALYYDFRELTPLGADGDQMIRRLTDRLVSVDLLDRAADLLDHQVRFRLEGAAQALIATRLAKIHLLNNAPDKAMEIIRLTRQSKLPLDIVNQRVLVEARVLTQLNRFEEADVLLADAVGAEVVPLRADIYWGAQDWVKTAAITGSILGTRWNNLAAPLSEQERTYLIRSAIAYSMLGDRQALAVLRARYLDAMQSGRFANAFDIMTSPEQRSSARIRKVARETAAVDSLQSFMVAYRNEFLQGAPTTVSMAN
ncbi:MAG: tetratricopeptide repeat protein [Proteobacteria bacterium]|nr:tetratricopeptide repeat protein [Pseudomonadota bacterium]